MLAPLGAGVLTVLASLAVGAAILRLSGRHDLKLAGGVGFAALIVAATVMVRLPGRGKTALVGLALLTLVSAWLVRGSLVPRLAWLPAGAALAVVFVLLMLPFLVAGHFGPLGVGMDGDLGFHLGWLYALAHGPPPFSFFSLGYPLGSESLGAALTALGFGDEPALLGVACAALGLTAVVACNALERHRWWLRVPAGVACGLPFLTAAYFGEASIKEPITGLFVFTLGLLAVGSARGESMRRDALAALVLAGAAFFVFGSAGLIFPIVLVLVRLFSERWSRPSSRAELVGQLGIVAALAAVAIVGLIALPSAAPKFQAASGFKVYLSGPPAGLFGGNLTRQLPLSEGLGVWFGHDFRVRLPSDLLASVSVALAIVLFLLAVLASLRRWRTNLLVPTLAIIALYLAGRLTTIPYFSVKLMVAGAPLVVLFIVSGLLELDLEPRATRLLGSMTRVHVLSSILVIAFVAAVLWSSAGALRSSPVDDNTMGAELASFRPIVGRSSVVYLGEDQWVPEWLRGTGLIANRISRPFPVQPGKLFTPPFDVDTLLPGFMAGQSYMITTRTMAGSALPSNWRLVAGTAHYELFARRGDAPLRSILPEGSAPGAILDCSGPPGRELITHPGIAAIRSAPIITTDWRGPTGLPLFGPEHGSRIGSGKTASTTMRLPPGRFELSLAYRSPTPLTFRVAGGGLSVRMTPTLEFLGPLFRAGVLSSRGGPIRLEASVARGYAPAPVHGGVVGAVWAVPVGARDKLVRLRAACGRYVDWYRTTG